MRSGASSPVSHITSPSASTHCAASVSIASSTAASEGFACRMLMVIVNRRDRRRQATRAQAVAGVDSQRRPHDREANQLRTRKRLAVNEHTEKKLQRRSDVLQDA